MRVSPRAFLFFNMRIKNWKKHQHFKDRKPPWIKLYRDILDDIEWHELDAKSAKVLIMLWLIASENDGELPPIKTLSFRLRMSEKDVISSCNSLSNWLIQDDINAISERYQSDSVETETEEETKKETEAPEGVSLQVWQDFKTSRKVKITKTALDAIKREADKAGWTLENALKESCSRGWRGFKADWVAEKREHSRYTPPQPNETVPSKPGIDPTLAALIADQMKTKPPPEEIRRQLFGDKR